MQSINRDKSVVIKRFYWDINNLFGDNNDGIWGSWRDYKALTKEQYRILEKCTSVMKDKLNHYGRSNEKFGLIHADLHFYNVINNNGVNQIIDFDDSGYGFYMYDMGCALVTYSRNLTKLEGAWVRGYEKVRKLSDEDKKFIPMFVLLRRITRLAWLATHSDSDTAKTEDDEYLDVTIDMAKEWLKANTKVAVITGAAGGIGYGIAKKFLESCK
jgi:Ser/Thr protein kinase RdoA (MazF antagonist)